MLHKLSLPIMSGVYCWFDAVQRSTARLAGDTANARACSHDAAAGQVWWYQRTSSISNDQRHVVGCQTISSRYTHGSCMCLYTVGIFSVIRLRRMHEMRSIAIDDPVACLSVMQETVLSPQIAPLRCDHLFFVNSDFADRYVVVVLTVRVDS